MKKFFLFPGRGKSKFDENIRNYLEENGFEVENLQINWSSSLQKNTNRFADELETSEFADTNIFLGFSWGSVTALANSTGFPVDHLILCSMSPDFKEDYRIMSRTKKMLNRIFSSSIDEKPSYPKTSADITFLYGEREYHGLLGLNSLGYGGKITQKRLEIYENSDQIIVENAGHRLNSNYREELKKAIEQL